jgi:YspA, cpYpsA-related SLOG family
MRVIVTGSRKWHLPEVVLHELSEVLKELPEGENLTVVHGSARSGADAYAAEWCRRWELSGYPCEERWPADWKRHGKRAGILRNIGMVDAGADVVLAFPLPDGKGTQHCMAYAAEREIPVRNFGLLDWEEVPGWLPSLARI